MKTDKPSGPVEPRLRGNHPAVGCRPGLPPAQTEEESIFAARLSGLKTQIDLPLLRSCNHQGNSQLKGGKVYISAFA
jgi:hypothetical protein